MPGSSSMRWRAGRAVALSATTRARRRGPLAVLRARAAAVWRLAAVAFLGFGVFVALTTWLQALLEPAGDQRGRPRAGCSPRWSSPAWRAPRCCRRCSSDATRSVRSCGAAAVIAAAGCLTLAFAPHAAIVVVIPLGVVLLGALPVLLE